MDSAKKHPLVFANNVIRLTADHVAGDKVIVLPQDYTTIRVTFRKLGGSWAKIADGDVTQARLLAKIVKKWGKLPGRKHESEMF